MPPDMTADIWDVAVVGAGAAGLMAAGTAAQNGRRVLLLDRNERPGRKLGITGKGRCNLTNNCDRDEFLRNVPRNPRFLYTALDAFGVEDTMTFFEGLGLPLVTERGDRVFPVSQRARDVIDALADWCHSGGVTFVQRKVTGLIIEEGRVVGVRTNAGDINAATVILATGGMSYPATGSTGLGYTLARQAGHRITELAPSLVPLCSEDPCCQSMQGLSLKNVGITVTDACEKKTNGAKERKNLHNDFGEMLFTHFGVSGPLILSASAHLQGHYPCVLHIDLKPALDHQTLDTRLLRDFGAQPNKQFRTALSGLLPGAMHPFISQRSGIPSDRPLHSITREQRKNLVEVLKDFSIVLTGPRSIEEAVVTSGGVDVREVSPGTMQSRLVKGICFAGEILDVDAYTGGFNLQIAWSTGYVAGMNV